MAARAKAAMALLFGLLAAPALAGDVPLGDADFIAYIQHKLQLYTPAPVRVTGPFSIAIGAPGGANLVFEFKTLHDDCMSAPAQCDLKTHETLQGIVSTFPSASSADDTGEAVPGGKAEFMAYVAAQLQRLVPADAVAIDGLTLEVTRPGGTAIAFDQRSYYQRCQDVGFLCASAMRQVLERTAAWLTPPEPGRLRVSLHPAADCGASGCAPSRDAMATFARPAFADLEEVCFKQLDDGATPMTNADRADAGLGIDAALDLCEKATHVLLGPLAAKSSAPGDIVAVAGPYAASRALFPADWAALAGRSGGHLLIAVPSRDLLLYMTGDSPADVAALAAGARAANTGALGIGANVYRWNGHGWSLAAP
jgi:hypothetical protein